MPKKKLPGTDTPVDTQRQIVKRHAAVLGLGALIEAFPYATPPPSWMPEVLAYLATRTASDPGIVGKATKSILAEFKKTRQDSWTVDQKVRLFASPPLPSQVKTDRFCYAVFHSGPAGRPRGRPLEKLLRLRASLGTTYCHLRSTLRLHSPRQEMMQNVTNGFGTSSATPAI